jgi:hypothetical protein
MVPETKILSRWSRRVLLAVLAFEGVGGLIGGPALVAAPDGRLMKMPVEILGGAFPDFLVPGLLLTLLGLLNVAAYVVVLRQMPAAWLWAGLALGGFAVWFIVELAIVGAAHWAQAVWGLPVLVGIIAALVLEWGRFMAPRTPRPLSA